MRRQKYTCIHVSLYHIRDCASTIIFWHFSFLVINAGYGLRKRVAREVTSPKKKTKDISSKLLEGKADDIISQPTCLKTATCPAEIIDGMNFGSGLIGDKSVNLCGPKMDDNEEKP